MNKNGLHEVLQQNACQTASFPGSPLYFHGTAARFCPSLPAAGGKAVSFIRPVLKESNLLFLVIHSK
jgi:hypothetical protein